MRKLSVFVFGLLLLSGCGVQFSIGDNHGFARPRAFADLAWDETVWAGEEFHVTATGYDSTIRRMRVSVDGYTIWDRDYFTYYVSEYVTMPYYVYGSVLVEVEAWDEGYGYGSDYVRVYVP